MGGIIRSWSHHSWAYITGWHRLPPQSCYFPFIQRLHAYVGVCLTACVCMGPLLDPDFERNKWSHTRAVVGGGADKGRETETRDWEKPSLRRQHGAHPQGQRQNLGHIGQILSELIRCDVLSPPKSCSVRLSSVLLI